MKVFGVILIVGGVVILTWFIVTFLCVLAWPTSDNLEILGLIPAVAAGMVAAGVLMRRAN